MLDQLMGLIKDHSQDAIVKNAAVPNDQNDQVMQTLLGSIMGGMQQEAQSGNVSGLMGLLSGKAVQPGSNHMMSNPIISGIAGHAIRSIMEKFGMSNSTASTIVAGVLPSVLSGLIRKTSNSQDSSIDFNGILGGLLGGQRTATPGGLDFNQIGYALSDGKLDINDLIRVGGGMLGNHAASPAQTPQKGGLDLDDLLGGLFNK